MTLYFYSSFFSGFVTDLNCVIEDLDGQVFTVFQGDMSVNEV